MQKPAIVVTNLSKKYSLGERQPYYSFRDTLSNLFSKPVNKLIKKEEKLDKGEFWALKDVSFEINEGEVIGIIGRNGAGKSTLLKILSQITPPSFGEIRLNGRVASLLEVGTGFHPELTGRENIYLNGAILGMKRSEINSRFDDIVEFAEIPKFLDTPVKHYSSGMYMRLAFAVAAHLEPEILLVDEVLAVGDAAFQKKCLGKMDDISKKSGRTILFVSHNIDSIKSLCPRSILMENGGVKTIGKTDSVVRKYIDVIRSSSSVDLGERKDRTGNGKGKYTKIAIGPKLGLWNNELISGAPAYFQLNFEMFDKAVKNIDFEIGIDTLTGHRVASISNKVFNKVISADKGVIKVEIDKLPLAPGKYTTNLMLIDRAIEVVDWIHLAGTFEVEEGNFYGSQEYQNNLPGETLLDFKVE